MGIGTRMSLGGYDDLLDKYDVQGPSFGRGGNEYRSPEDVEKDLLKAAAGHAGTVNALQSAALSGKKKAQDLIKDGFQSIDDLTNVENFLQKSAKRHGMGGDFSSPSDFVGLSLKMAERDRRKQGEMYDDKYATQDQLEEALEKVKSGGMKDLEEKEPEKSEQTLKDEATVKDWEENWSTGGIYNTIGPAKKTPGTAFLDWYMSENFQDDSALMPEIS